MELCSAFFEHLADSVPGSTSVNELRILAAIGMATIKDEQIGVTALARRLNIPLSTTSRHCARLCEVGRVVALTDPRDDRRKYLRFSSTSMEGFALWAQGCLSIREQVMPLLARPATDP